MRALLCKSFGPPDALELATLDDPVPGDGELLVAIEAAGLNFPDLLVIAGQYQMKTEPPFVPGSEAAGVVAAVGPGVTRFKPGDAVMLMPGIGTFAERCVVAEAQAMPMLPGLDFAQAAGFTITYGTSYHALKQQAALAAGERVLVLGASGGVGITAVEIAAAMGAEVIAAASSDEKLDYAREAGATHGINYSTSSLRDSVRELTGNRGVDVVYDPVGGELAQQALKSLAWHGRHLVIGFASGDIPAFPANIALLKEASIVGVWWGTWASRNPRAQAANVEELAAMLADGRINPRISGRYALEDYREAFAEIAQRRVLGKVVLTMNRSIDERT